MARYVALRVLRALFTVAAVVTLVFVLVRAVPGDPVDTILGDTASHDDRARMRARLHLDESLPRQYARFVGDVVSLELGRSFRSDRSVASLIEDVAPPTAALAFVSLALALCLAIPLGLFAAARGGWTDRAASGFAVLGLAIPNIWLGPLLLLVFSLRLGWTPLPGAADGSLLLPSITLGTALCAVLTRQTRAATLDAMRRPHVQTAKAKGLSNTRVLLAHGFRTALLPVLTIVVAQLGALLSGTVVVEKIFERQGVGALFLEAFFARDIPVVQGVVLLVAIIYVVSNLALDLAYAALDPRVRLTGGAS